MTRKTLGKDGLSLSLRNQIIQVGQQIKLARKRRGLTMQEMADRMFVTRKTLKRLESGDPGVSIGILASALLSIGLEKDLIHLANPNFQYGKKYLQRENAISIDPVQLPLGHSIFRSVPKSPLFGGIRDAAPDGWGRHLIDRAADSLSPGEFEYLTAFAPEHRIGALGFGSSIEHGPGSIDPVWANYPPHGAELDLENMIAAADQIETAAAISPEYRINFPLGGAIGISVSSDGGDNWDASMIGTGGRRAKSIYQLLR